VGTEDIILNVENAFLNIIDFLVVVYSRGKFRIVWEKAC
jgi:hypothetical protein